MNVAGAPRSTGRGAGTAGDKEAMMRAVQELDFYSEPPNFEMTLDEFEEFALDRLKILRKIEELKTRNIAGDNFDKAVDKAIQTNLLNTTDSKKKKDVGSHFILRAAYCKTEDLRRWFLSQESFLFKYRLEKLFASKTGSAALRTFLKLNDLNYIRVGEKEKESMRPYLLSIPITGDHSNNNPSTGNITSTMDYNRTIYYKIPFTKALDLIAKRQCHVSAGYAYVPLNKIITIITAKFRSALSKSLTIASLSFSQVVGSDESSRIAPLLNNMNSQYTGRNYDNSTNKLSGDMELNHTTIDDFANSSMPLCMSQLHSGLQKDSKLRHFGRLQYGLFLKGAGLSMEESLLFFQRKFAKMTNPEEFNKNYAYNIRHMYGKEGKRANYTPYNCVKIIMNNAPQTSGDHHGCPFRHYDEEHLSVLLNKLKIGSVSEREEIKRLKREKHYQLACVKHFEVVHPNAASAVKDLDLNGVGNHPNAWFAASVKYRGTLSGGESDKEKISVDNFAHNSLVVEDK